MARLKPYSGASPVRLTALINQDNHSAIQLGRDFTFGEPTAYTDADGRDTQVTLTPAEGSAYVEPVDVFYKRLDLTALDRLPSGEVFPVVIPAVPFSIHPLLPAINAALGLDLTEAEVEDQTFTTVEQSYPLVIKPEACLAWRYSVYNFPAVFVEERLMEDGTARLLEDGTIRLLEVPIPVE